MMYPSLFISHGSPDLLLQEGEDHRFLMGLSGSLPKPRAIICISAHWDTAGAAITADPSPATIHDFYGFQPELYQRRYCCPGDPLLAARVAELLGKTGIGQPALATGRGLDHGAWVPLSLMYPDAEIPVVQLSVQTASDTSQHYRIGAALAPLRQEGVLIIGSGGATHNLAEYGRFAQDADAEPYVEAFDEWLALTLENGEVEDLLAYRQRAPQARRNHPTEEHFLPIFAPCGAALGGRGKRLHQHITYGVLSMAAFAWGLDEMS